MDKNSQNPFYQARLYAGMSRAQAAMLINSSESSIKEYELGRKVPEEIVLEMTRVYKTPWLRVQYLLENAVFRDVFGVKKLEVKSEAETVLSMQSEINDVQHIMPRIIKSTLDKSSDIGIIKECREAMTALFMFIGIKKEKASCVAGTKGVL